MRPALLGALTATALAGCATTEPPHAVVATAPDAPVEPYLSMMIPADVATVGPALEEVGAHCWLDAELQAANLLVDQSNGNLTFFSDGGQILSAQLHPVRTTLTEIRLRGTAMDSPGRYARLKSSLEKTVATGTATC